MKPVLSSVLSSEQVQYMMYYYLYGILFMVYGIYGIWYSIETPSPIFDLPNLLVKKVQYIELTPSILLH